jgi:hypothetical protein
MPRWCWRRYLNYNQLTGAIPDSLGSLSSLMWLCVPVRWLCAHATARHSMAAFGGVACSGAAHALYDWWHRPRVLLMPRWCWRRNLNYNQLTGPIPDSLGSLSSLWVLCVPVC